jgi:hypothetical protein
VFENSGKPRETAMDDDPWRRAGLEGQTIDREGGRYRMGGLPSQKPEPRNLVIHGNASWHERHGSAKISSPIATSTFSPFISLPSLPRSPSCSYTDPKGGTVNPGMIQYF